MPIIEECLRTRSQITHFRVLENDLAAYSTAYNGIKIFSLTDPASKLNIADKNFNTHVSCVSFSQDARYIAFSILNSIYIIQIANQKLIRTIKTTEEIETLTFEPTSTYIIAGTKNGRVLQYKYNSTSLIARLHSFKNDPKSKQKIAVTAFGFYKNNAACGNNRGELVVLNIHSRTTKRYIKNSSTKINAIHYVNDELLLYGNDKGELFFHSLESDILMKQIDTPHTAIKQILPVSNPNYVLVSSETDFVSLVNIQTYKVQHTKYVQFEEEIVEIDTYKDDILFAALYNNTIVQVELPSLNRLQSHIIHNSLDLAYKLVQKDNTLKDSPQYLELEKRYQSALQRASEALINQNKKLALELLDIFKDVDEKKEEIAELFKAFEHYTRFQALYREKKYPLAYAMCSRYPQLQQTYPYTLMEKDWQECFKNAQRHINNGNLDHAKALLKEYMTIPQKRAVIDMMLTQNKSFVEFIKAIESKNYTKISELSKENPFFAQIPTYKNLESEIEERFKEIKMDIYSGQIKSAKEKLSNIEHTTETIEKIALLQQKLLQMQKLQSAYKNNDLRSCYEVLDSNSLLIFSDLGMQLEQEWIQMMTQGEEFALKGDIKELKTLLGDLLQLESRREKIGDLLRISFHSKIKMLIAKKAHKQAENIIYSYIDIFGLDTEISTIMQIFEQVFGLTLALTYNQNKRPPRDNWIHSKVIMG